MHHWYSGSYHNGGDEEEDELKNEQTEKNIKIRKNIKFNNAFKNLFLIYRKHNFIHLSTIRPVFLYSARN